MKRIILTGLVLTGILGQACATSSPSPYPARVNIPSPGPGLEPNRRAEYVLPTRRCGDFFIVDARVNGAGPFPLLLDSGAGATALDPRGLRSAGIQDEVDSLQIGAFEAFDVAVRSLDMTDLSHALREPLLGIVGHPVFAAGTLTYDFPRGEVRLSRDALAPEDPLVVPGRESTRPWVVADLGSEQSWVLIDTGSSRGLALTDLATRDGVAEPVMTGASMRVDGLHANYSMRLRDTIRVGPILLDRPVVGSSASPNLLGQQVLHRFAVSFDARSGLIRFERPEASSNAPLATSALLGTGHIARPLADVQIVEVVLEGSPAAAAGLAPGDTVVAVDGVAVGEMGCRLPWVARELETGPVVLSIRRRRGQEEIRVERVVLVH